MTFQIKREIIEQEYFSSSTIFVGSVFVHRVTADGSYEIECTISDGEQIVLELTASAAAVDTQRDIDLVELFRSPDSWRAVALRTGGYISAFAKEGRHSYSIRLNNKNTGESIRLGETLLPDDVFLLYPWRPGLYNVRLDTRVAAQVKIEYPNDQIRRSLMAPRSFAVTQGAISPQGVAVQPAQGVKFSIIEETSGPIELVLETAIDDRATDVSLDESTKLVINEEPLTLSGVKLPWHESVMDQAGAQFVLVNAVNNEETNCRVESVHDSDDYRTFELTEVRAGHGLTKGVLEPAIAAVYLVGDNDPVEFPDELHDAALNSTREINGAPVCPYTMLYVCYYVTTDAGSDEIRVVTQYFLCRGGEC